ncbi:hypothetical protein [Thalassobaculum litoreum]|uniref:Uncharacterized protein n=1 Tax=Thalassobaculum litoreum DSM 18839 TaxID=1123362 RepID=A0A8G2EYH5_9PROT|nr:hypothetical protein [Thalassobaculum litoreum]SDF83438.1 hypothetical protein SAMN05660686_02466 [Thalassobaculum litoreum DSM 18839]
MATPNTIRLRGGTQTDERLAAAAITPGDLIELTSDNEFQRQSVASGNSLKMFALENPTLGRTITDDYASGDTVIARQFQPGDRVYANLAASQTIVIGDLLEGNNAGKLQKHVVDSTGIYYHNQIVGFAIEAVTTTGAVGRIKIQIV